MSNRVEEQAAKQAQEAERLQKKAETEARQAKTSEASRETFAKLVKGNAQQGSKEEKMQTEKNQTESRQNEAAQKGSAKSSQEADRNARMARGGVVQHSRVMEQAKSFSQVLNHQTTDTKQADQGRVERRDDGGKKDRVERDDRERDVERKESVREKDQEVARVEAREARRPNAAIDGGAKGDKGDGRGGDGSQAAQLKASQLQAAQGPKAAHKVKQIPTELLERLVNAVYLAVNDKGLKEFQIELKDGPLKGGFMKISADGGKIALQFEGLDGEQKRLIEASKGELMRRLESKGLGLTRLEVR